MPFVFGRGPATRPAMSTAAVVHPARSGFPNIRSAGPPALKWRPLGPGWADQGSNRRAAQQKPQPTNTPPPVAARILELGIWDLFGLWALGFGASPPFAFLETG